MALGFIKKVFSFGKDKPAETPADAAVETAALPTSETAAVPADDISRSDLPGEPVVPTEADLELLPLALLDGPALETETPAADPSCDAPESIVQTAAPATDTPATDTPASNAAAADAADAVPPSVPAGHLPLKGGDRLGVGACFTL